MSKAPPPGIYVPAILFFDSNEDLDESAIQSHVLRLAQAGVTGILVQGSNGEAQHLSREERLQTIGLTRRTLDDNGFKHVLVIAGTGAQTTRETKLLNEDAHKAGATHALVLTPSTWFQKMTKDVILRFHREVADASPIPIMIYNFPSVTAGIDLDSDVLSALAQHPNIVGTKLSCANVGKLARLTSTFTKEQFAVFPGSAAITLPSLLCGSAGLIGALPNLFPAVHVKLYKLWEQEKIDEAMAIQQKLAHADWETQKMGVGGIKAIVSQQWGYGEPRVRGPLPSGDVGYKLQEGGVLENLVKLEKETTSGQ